jgi:hypothetical protein
MSELHFGTFCKWPNKRLTKCVSAAEKIRLILRRHGENSLTNRQIAEMAGTTPHNVEVVKSRLRKPARQRNFEQRFAWLEQRVRVLEAVIADLQDPSRRLVSRAI